MFEKIDFTAYNKIDTFEFEGRVYQIENRVIYNADRTVLIYCDPEKEGEFTAPEGLKKIGYKAFARTKLSYIVFKNGLESIGEKAFEGFDDISHTVVLPKTVCDISPSAFTTIKSWWSLAGRMRAYQDHAKIHANILLYKEKDSIPYAPWGSLFAEVIWRPK